jgi:hypothetical protein
MKKERQYESWIVVTKDDEGLTENQFSHIANKFGFKSKNKRLKVYAVFKEKIDATRFVIKGNKFFKQEGEETRLKAVPYTQNKDYSSVIIDDKFNEKLFDKFYKKIKDLENNDYERTN